MSNFIYAHYFVDGFNSIASFGLPSYGEYPNMNIAGTDLNKLINTSIKHPDKIFGCYITEECNTSVGERYIIKGGCRYPSDDTDVLAVTCAEKKIIQNIERNAQNVIFINVDEAFYCLSPEDDIATANVEVFKEIVDKTKAKVVIASAFNERIREVTSVFAEYNIEIACRRPFVYGADRSDLIKAWLYSNPAVRNFAIIDNQNYEDLNDHLIRTSYEYGLTPDLIHDVVNLLTPDKARGEETFYVTFAVTGNYTVKVLARNQQEAMNKAENAFFDADFGELAEIDGSIHHIDDKNDNRIFEV